MTTKAWKYLCCNGCGSFYVEWDMINKWYECKYCNLVMKPYVENERRKGERRMNEEK